MSPTATAHICLDDHGVAWIDNTNTKVVEVILDRNAYGWSPEEIHFQHRHLSLAQIYAAFAYYHDHREETDQAIREIETEYDARREQAKANGQVTRAELEARLAKHREVRKSA